MGIGGGKGKEHVTSMRTGRTGPSATTTSTGRIAQEDINVFSEELYVVLIEKTDGITLHIAGKRGVFSIDHGSDIDFWNDNWHSSVVAGEHEGRI